MADVANIGRAINCSYGSIPFNYPGLPVSKRMNKLDAWNGVVGKLSERLATWKINLLSIGGRLTLVKSVLGSLPLYHLSLFRAPTSVISLIEALRRNFFWVSKKLRKRKAISKIHDSDAGFETISGSGQKAGVWANIIGCCSKLNQMGISLNNHMVKKVSSGNQTRFWGDAWIKDIGPLKFCFSRLFALEMNTNYLVDDKWSLLDGVWQGIWAWSRQPCGRALDDLSVLSYLINGLVLDRSREDN
uniref:Reverse transcriptase domain, reverse transcriptase zinc-binding domain protein n=1 Tax=Tanacetum cinerariifolium TaxID=118510 RepID=A0A6L2N072_TANCI|nr:reverse transcriptase domain, reverse transcriptase zinc-binding domain protein [Tanacetum cinerariifolium]